MAVRRQTATKNRFYSHHLVVIYEDEILGLALLTDGNVAKELIESTIH